MVFNELAERLPEQKLILKFYGGGDCYDVIEAFCPRKNLIINVFGKVPKAEIQKEMELADFLINITNSYKAIVPSKIFELFATCKPIVNVISNQDDGSLSYFEKYPLVYSIIAEEKSFDKEIEDLKDFICICKGARADFSEVKSLYYANTPQFVCERIVEWIQEKYDE